MSDIRIEVVRDAGIVVVRFAHAPTRNALDRATRSELIDRLDDWEADDDVRVIILTGIDPAFTSGVDVTQLRAAGYRPLQRNPAETLRAMGTLTIAAVNGACVSGGLEIALGCSFIIASERARFADSHARLGIVPGWGLSAALPAAIGVARARQMSATGAFIDAGVARSWGLVNEVVPHAALMARCHELATVAVGIDRDASRAVMRLYRVGQDAALDAALVEERAVAERWGESRAGADA